jgi:hypothetical protein
MWVAVAASAGFLLLGGQPRPAIATTVLAAGVVGTVVMVRLGRRSGRGECHSLAGNASDGSIETEEQKSPRTTERVSSAA